MCRFGNSLCSGIFRQQMWMIIVNVWKGYPWLLPLLPSVAISPMVKLLLTSLRVEMFRGLLHRHLTGTFASSLRGARLLTSPRHHHRLSAVYCRRISWASCVPPFFGIITWPFLKVKVAACMRWLPPPAQYAGKPTGCPSKKYVKCCTKVWFWTTTWVFSIWSQDCAPWYDLTSRVGGSWLHVCVPLHVVFFGPGISGLVMIRVMWRCHYHERFTINKPKRISMR